MVKKNLTLIYLFIFLLSVGIYFYQTLNLPWYWVYWMLIPFILAGVVVLCFFLKYLIFKEVRFFNLFLLISAISCFVIEIALYVKLYKPDYYIEISDNYVGRVLLFPAREYTERTRVNYQGIGYINLRKNANIIIMRNNADISKAYNQAHFTNILYPPNNYEAKQVISVICFPINNSNTYPGDYGPYYEFCTLDVGDFETLIGKGVVDTSKMMFVQLPKLIK